MYTKNVPTKLSNHEFTNLFPIYGSQKCTYWAIYSVAFWVLPCTSLLKICTHYHLPTHVSTIGIYLHIYLVSSGCFPAHLYKRCVHWASTQTSFLNICTLGIYPCTTILKICILGISLHICIKDVYIGHLPTHIS